MPSPANAGPARHDAATINQKRISAPFATCGEHTVGTWTGKCRERFALDSAFLPSGGAVFPLCSKLEEACTFPEKTFRSRDVPCSELILDPGEGGVAAVLGEPNSVTGRACCVGSGEFGCRDRRRVDRDRRRPALSERLPGGGEVISSSASVSFILICSTVFSL